MTQASTYQVMPPLSADEYAALKADIAEHGVRVPVDVDEHYDTHRTKIGAVWRGIGLAADGAE